jgi:hypothetical protein
VLSIRLRRRRESCIAAFLLMAMFRYSRASNRDLVGSQAAAMRDRVIDFAAGRDASPETSATADEAAAHHQARVRVRRLEPTALMGFSPFADLIPIAGAMNVSTAAGLRAVCRSLAAIYFRRGIVRPEKSVCEKGRTIMSSRLDFQA